MKALLQTVKRYTNVRLYYLSLFVKLIFFLMGTLSTDTISQPGHRGLAGWGYPLLLLCSSCLALALTISSPNLLSVPKCEQGGGGESRLANAV